MLSTGLAKVCFVAVALQALLGWNLVSSSSIYVGRHEAGTYSEHGPSESVVSEGKRKLMRARKLYMSLLRFRISGFGIIGTMLC